MNWIERDWDGVSEWESENCQKINSGQNASASEVRWCDVINEWDIHLPIIGANLHELPIIGNSFGPGTSE